MGRMLGAFADDEELDRPDLNKCPDCNCFFDGDICPICKKVCPEEMRAGNRPAVKPKKNKKASYSSGRVTFVEWYHSWWFITLMVLFLPIVGIILLFTSPHKKWQKILFVAIAVVYLAISTIGIGTIISMFEKPVNTSLSREEYIAECEVVSPERIYRSFDAYEDKYVTLDLKIIEEVEYYDGPYYSGDAYYLCEAEGGSSYKIIIRDCIIEGKQQFIAGDVVTVWGECDEEILVCGMGEEYSEWEGPCVNVAYAKIK